LSFQLEFFAEKRVERATGIEPATSIALKLNGRRERIQPPTPAA
jgi:hypothetical protein